VRIIGMTDLFINQHIAEGSAACGLHPPPPPKDGGQRCQQAAASAGLVWRVGSCIFGGTAGVWAPASCMNYLRLFILIFIY
jgi:hypothetical protein